MDPITVIFQLAILVFAVVIHEVSHGLIALYLGDPTAKYAGRLTLNPLAHLDIWGSFVVPLLLFFSSGFVFGWAKPVPYNPYNLRDQKYGPGLVALAGPAANLLMAVIFGLLIRFLLSIGISGTIFVNLINFFLVIVLINLVLGIFNLFPIPPLDGSKILFTFLPISEKTKMMLESYGFFILIIFIFVILGAISPLINIFIKFIIEGLTGVTL